MASVFPKKRVKAFWVLWAAGSILAAAQAVEFKLTVREPGEAARTPAMVTTGIPFERGQLADVATLAVEASGTKIPAQFRAIVPWDDGSIRWALMDVQVPVTAGAAVELTVSNTGGNPAPPMPVQVQEDSDRLRVSTGVLDFSLPKNAGGLFNAVSVQGSALVGNSGRGAVLTLEDGRDIVAGAPQEVDVEEAGPMRAVVRLHGSFPDVHDGLMRYTVRITAYAGQPRIHVRYRLENHGAIGYGEAKPEWFSFASMAIELGLALGDTISVVCEGTQADNNFRLLQRCLMMRERDGRHSGGPYFTMDDFIYTITQGDTTLKQGDRTDGILELKGERGRLVAGIREFWQNYDKAMELSEGKLRLWLWPSEGQWPRQRIRNDHWHGNDGLKDAFLISMASNNKVYRYPGGLQKAHDVVLDFSDASVTQVGAELNTPLFALAMAEHYAATDAAPGLFAPPEARVQKNGEANFKLASLGRMQQSASDPDSPTSVFAARKVSWSSAIGYWGARGLWYGWMDFGDISVPGRGQTGVDEWSYQMLLNGIRFGQVHGLKLGDQKVRHSVDIDQLWSDRDTPRNRKLQKRGGGARFAVYPDFHTTQLRYQPRLANVLSGIVLHYMLTGDPMSLKAAQRYGEGLVAVWAEIEAGGITSAANTISAFVSLYEVTGDAKWKEQALTVFKGHIMPLRERFGPHLHSSSQIQGQGYSRNDQAYCLAIQWLCELHHATGDEQVMQLLVDGCEREFNADNFYLAPAYLSGLFAYVGLRNDNLDYLKRASSLFAQSFPESRSPPVFLPNNSTWHEDASSMMRSGQLLQYGWWQHNLKTP